MKEKKALNPNKLEAELTDHASKLLHYSQWNYSKD